MGGVAKIFKNNKIDKYIYIYIYCTFIFIFSFDGERDIYTSSGGSGLKHPAAGTVFDPQAFLRHCPKAVTGNSETNAKTCSTATFVK